MFQMKEFEFAILAWRCLQILLSRNTFTNPYIYPSWSTFFSGRRKLRVWEGPQAYNRKLKVSTSTGQEAPQLYRYLVENDLTVTRIAEVRCNHFISLKIPILLIAFIISILWLSTANSVARNELGYMDQKLFSLGLFRHYFVNCVRSMWQYRLTRSRNGYIGDESRLYQQPIERRYGILLRSLSPQRYRLVVCLLREECRRQLGKISQSMGPKAAAQRIFSREYQ